MLSFIRANCLWYYSLDATAFTHSFQVLDIYFIWFSFCRYIVEPRNSTRKNYNTGSGWTTKKKSQSISKWKKSQRIPKRKVKSSSRKQVNVCIKRKHEKKLPNMRYDHIIFVTRVGSFIDFFFRIFPWVDKEANVSTSFSLVSSSIQKKRYSCLSMLSKEWYTINVTLIFVLRCFG